MAGRLHLRWPEFEDCHRDGDSVINKASMKPTHPSITRERRAVLPHSFANPRAMARLLGISILIVLTAASAKAVQIFGINNANNNLVRFDHTTPGTFIS